MFFSSLPVPHAVYIQHQCRGRIRFLWESAKILSCFFFLSSHFSCAQLSFNDCKTQTSPVVKGLHRYMVSLRSITNIELRGMDIRNIIEPRGRDLRNIIEPRGRDLRNIIEPRGGVSETSSRGRGRKEMFYLTMHSTHFIYGYMASDIWLRTTQIVREETCCRHMGYSFWLTARVLLYASSHRQEDTYHSLCYTSSGALAGTRNSSMRPPWRIDPTSHHTMSERSYHGATSRSREGGVSETSSLGRYFWCQYNCF